MPLKYRLYPNVLKQDGSCYARVALNSIYNKDRMIARMLGKGTSLTRNELTGVLALLEETIEEVIQDGHGVHLDGFLKIKPSLRGVFNSNSDGFNASRHRLDINTKMDIGMKKRIIKSLTLEKTERTIRMPFIDQITGRKERKPGFTYTALNQIIGCNLNRFPLHSIVISARSNPEQKLELTTEVLDIPVISNREIIFLIMSDTEKPTWIQPGTDLTLTLHYRKDYEIITTNHFDLTVL